MPPAHAQHGGAPVPDQQRTAAGVVQGSPFGLERGVSTCGSLRHTRCDAQRGILDTCGCSAVSLSTRTRFEDLWGRALTQQRARQGSWPMHFTFEQMLFCRTLRGPDGAACDHGSGERSVDGTGDFRERLMIQNTKMRVTPSKF